MISKNVKVKNAKTHEYDNLIFKSGLELFCYKQLKENNIPFTYQPESYVLIAKFKSQFRCYEDTGKITRDSNKKILSSTKRFDLIENVREIAYTPDFQALDGSWIIETKGFSNDAFPLRWKLFKAKLNELEFTGIVMKPESQKEVLQCIEIIKEENGNIHN
jgi:hypothetical protein